MIELKILNKQQVNEQWDDIRPWLESSLDFSPDIKFKDIVTPILNGSLITISVREDLELKGAVVIKLKHTKEGRVAVVLAIGGNWICTRENIDELKSILRTIGAIKMTGIARPSVARLWDRLGIRSLYTVMETDI